MDDPLLPIGGLLVAGALGFVAYRVVQRRRQNNGVDSSFLESRIQPDSFFGASGGQRVDTANSDMTTGSSMAYSPSQLDAGGDVDPVAEADVYLAYGRDLQAEEILKEAVRHNPGRVSVHVKLGEIYAKRQDRKALEAVAGEVFKLTQGEGPDWARIAELGRDLEPDNRLYQPGGRPGMGEDESPSLPPGGFPSTFTGAGGTAAAARAGGSFLVTAAHGAARPRLVPRPLPPGRRGLALEFATVSDRRGALCRTRRTGRRRALAARRAAGVHRWPAVMAPGSARACARQRSSVATLTPTSRDTTSTAALSGGSSRATMRSLNAFPYRATLVHLRPSFRFHKHATTRLTQGGPRRG